MHDRHRFAPRVNSVSDASPTNEFVDENYHFGYRHFLSQCDQPVPYKLCVVEIAGIRQ